MVVVVKEEEPAAIEANTEAVFFDPEWLSKSKPVALHNLSLQELKILLLLDRAVTNFVDHVSKKLFNYLMRHPDHQSEAFKLSSSNPSDLYQALKRALLNKEEMKLRKTLRWEKKVANNMKVTEFDLNSMSDLELATALNQELYPIFRILFGLMQAPPVAWISAVRYKQWRNEVSHPTFQDSTDRRAALEFVARSGLSRFKSYSQGLAAIAGSLETWQTTGLEELENTPKLGL